MAYTDLDRAMLMGVEATIQDMTSRGSPIHVNTLQAQAWFREKTKL